MEDFDQSRAGEMTIDTFLESLQTIRQSQMLAAVDQSAPVSLESPGAQLVDQLQLGSPALVHAAGRCVPGVRHRLEGQLPKPVLDHQSISGVEKVLGRRVEPRLRVSHVVVSLETRASIVGRFQGTSTNVSRPG
ncbi:MAG: hypothetical protein RLZ37_95 [Actinomycetota bacterium]